ncbi:7887_t:CDS:2, partial [Racocetra persica]
ETNTLINLFWMSPEQIMLWCEFNEAVGHDNTMGFSATKLYLEHHLYNRRFSWACAFTAIIFTLGIQTTSFVESQNTCIKQVLKNSNTSLCNFGKVLIERSKEEQKRKPNVAHFLVEQMKESLYYTASHATVKKIESLTSYESSQSKDIDDKPDAIVLCAMYLLEYLERTSIVKIWKISRVTSQGAQFSLQLIAPCWIPKSQRLDAVKECIYF